MSALPLTFAEFYLRHLREHRRRGTRILHFVGTTLFLVSMGLVAAAGYWGWLWRACGRVRLGLGGPLFLAHNRPATFQHPWFSLLGDFRPYADLWWGREKFRYG